jgi:hypothetical protein
MPSTATRDIAYDASSQRLMVTFVTGRTYVYEDVPPDVAAAFETAPSKRRFFNARIRDRYRYREVAPTYE